MKSQNVSVFLQKKLPPKFFIFVLLGALILIHLFFFNMGSRLLPQALAAAPSASALTASSGRGSVSLLWSAPTDNGGAPILNYMVLRGAGPSAYTDLVATLPAATTNYSNSGLSANQTYYYAVMALNGFGQTSLSNQASAAAQGTDGVSQTPPAGLSYPGGDNQNSSPASSSGLFASGTLLLQNGTVYMVYRGKKSGFGNYEVFQNFGFTEENTTPSDLTQLPDTGHVISNANVSHPWGSWLASGGNMYFRHQDGLIPVPSLEIMAANGGRGGWLVPANSHDLVLPQLPAMQADDIRLK